MNAMLLMLPPDALSAAQRKLLELPVGQSAIVIGAAGTGKSSVLRSYLAEHLCSGRLAESEVLLLAANRSAASVVRDELTLELGRTIEGPLVRSVASLAFELVSDALGETVTLLTGAEHDQLIAELLAGEIEDATDGYWPKPLGRDLRALSGFRAELREFVMRLTEYGIDEARIRGLAAPRPEWLAAARFAATAARVAERSFPNQFDAAELVARAARVVRGGQDVPLRDRLRVLIVDDLQDASQSAVELLKAFAARGVAIVAAGNPDVASAGFRSGRVDIVGSFGEIAPGAHAVRLEESFRLPESLLEPYSRLVATIGTSGSVAQRTVRAQRRGGSVVAATAPSTLTEARLIADDLRERHLLGGVSFQDMVVVCRSARAALALEAQLGRLGVPTRRNASRLLIRDEPGARWLLDAAALSYQSDPFALPAEGAAGGVAEHAVALLTGPLGGLDPVALRRLRLQLRRAALGERPEAGFEARYSADRLLCDAMAVPAEFRALGTPEGRAAAHAAQSLHDARALAATGSIEEVLWLLWTQSEAAERWSELANGSGVLAEEANRSLDAVVALQAAARRFVERRPSESGATFVRELLLASVPEDSLAPERHLDTVLVTTPGVLVGHSWRHVVIAGLQEGVWPNLRPRNSLLHVDELIAALAGTSVASDAASVRREVRSDEYRLAALALSRAEASVLLTAVANEETAPSALLSLAGEFEEYRPRPFNVRRLVAQLRRRVVEAARLGSSDPVAAAALARLAAAQVPGAAPEEWYGMLPASSTDPIRDDPHPVSPSSVEKVEESALRWFVDRFAPEPAGAPQAVGTMVHEALERADPANPDLTEMIRVVADKWDAIHFEAEWVKNGRFRAVEKMLRRVSEYLRLAHADGRRLAAVEAGFEFQVDDIRVSGRIDRIERTRDGALFVIDLKTGKKLPTAKSMPENAQLQLYQLAAERGAIEGVEPAPLAGAALLGVDSENEGGTLLRQPALDEAGSAAADERIRRASTRMTAAQFAAQANITSFSTDFQRRYRMHTIPAVSE